MMLADLVLIAVLVAVVVFAFKPVTRGRERCSNGGAPTRGTVPRIPG